MLIVSGMMNNIRIQQILRCLSSTVKLQEISPRSIKLFGQKQKECNFPCLYLTPNSQNKPQALTLLLGWMGSRTKTLSKYAEMHLKRNSICSCFAPSLFDAWILSSARRKARKFFRASEETFAIKTAVPLVVHIFSGASLLFLYSLLPMLEQDSSPLQLKGIVFDSSPPIFGKEAGMAAAKLLRQQGVYTGLSYYLGVSGGMVSDVLLGDMRRAERVELLQNKLLLSVPHLYLYSETDPVFPSSQARDVISQQKERGAEVFEHAFKDTSHVRIFADHPEEYRSEVECFLTRCLKSEQ